ncbi:MAG: hypothetical protein AAGI30_12975 [Planctomycetota bacterium]
MHDHTHSPTQHTSARRARLGIETSNPRGEQGRAEVALRLPSEPDLIEPVTTQGHGTDDLIPAIDRVCKRAAVTPNELEVVAVSIGPGGYTACRVAVTVAKLIAEATGAALVGVPTPVGAAAALPPDVRTASPVIALAWKRDTAWRYTPDDDTTADHPSGELVPLDTLVTELGAATLVCDTELRHALVDHHHLPVEYPGHPIRFSASAVLDAAERIAPCDPADLLPLYPREPEAVTKWRALRGA